MNRLWLQPAHTKKFTEHKQTQRIKFVHPVWKMYNILQKKRGNPRLHAMVSQTSQSCLVYFSIQIFCFSSAPKFHFADNSLNYIDELNVTKLYTWEILVCSNPRDCVHVHSTKLLEKKACIIAKFDFPPKSLLYAMEIESINILSSSRIEDSISSGSFMNNFALVLFPKLTDFGFLC